MSLLQGSRWRLPKRWYPPMRLQGFIRQRNHNVSLRISHKLKYLFHHPACAFRKKMRIFISYSQSYITPNSTSHVKATTFEIFSFQSLFSEVTKITLLPNMMLMYTRFCAAQSRSGRESQDKNTCQSRKSSSDVPICRLSLTNSMQLSPS
jgi:hypothetical protein